MIYRKWLLIPAAVLAFGAVRGPEAADVMAGEEKYAQSANFLPGWNQKDRDWYFLDQDGTLHEGWLSDGGRNYHMDEYGHMDISWKEVDGDWYYFHQDGAMNLGTLTLDNAQYEFTRTGALKSASWVENTGGGPYHAGCYDEVTQSLLDDMNEEKKDLYFDEHPDREDEDDSDMRHVFDRNAGFMMDMELNKAAAYRLQEAAANGYMAGKIPGEGTINDYLGTISYHKNATCLELYVRDCEDEAEAYEKVLKQTEERYDEKGDRKYSLAYYRTLGMAHKEDGNAHSFMVILMR